MDSLVANYASSDEEEQSVGCSPSLFSSLPPPSRNSSFSLKTLKKDVAGYKPSSLFSSLPPPKPHNPSKRLVEFKPPISFALAHHHHDDDDDDDDGPRPKKRPSSSASASAGGLSTLLPPPKNTPLGGGAGESGHVGRRSLIEIPSSSAVEPLPSTLESNTVEAPQSAGKYHHDADCYNGNNYSVDPAYNMAAWPESNVHGNWEVGVSVPYDSSSSAWQEHKTEEDPAYSQGIYKAERRGGRNQIPTDIIEVKQDELMSNRPREDQVKLTGIAFGPSYKPVSAAKDKPSKLHKRKHQIGSLYYELKQKEMELAERRARGQLTKAETQAKYGW